MEKEKISYSRKINDSDDEVIFSVVTIGQHKKIIIPKTDIDITNDVDNDMLILTLKIN